MINEIVNNGFFGKPSSSNASTVASDVAAATASATAHAAQGTTVSKPSPDQLDAAVSKLNDYVQNVQRTLSFSVDKETGDTVVKVIDTSTNELIRQIPSEEMLKLAAAIDKETANLFIQERA